MLRYITFLFLILVLIACSSNNPIISYEILRPAKHTVPPEIKSVVLINNSYPYQRKDIHIAIIDGIKQVLDTVIFEGYADSVLVSLNHSLQYKHFFDTVYIDTTHYNDNYSSKPLRELSEYQIKLICDKYNADAVLSLEAYVYGTELEVEKFPDIYYSTMAVHGFNYWRLYDVMESESILSDMQKDTIYWYGEGGNIESSIFRFPNLQEANTEFAFYMGEEFSRLLVPEWERIERQLYIKGNSYFVAANDWLGKDNPDEARKLWNYIYENGKDLEKARAAHNIAVTLEREGDVENALMWSYQSYSMYNQMLKALYADEKTDAENYYVYLTHRKNEIKKIG